MYVNLILLLVLYIEVTELFNQYLPLVEHLKMDLSSKRRLFS